MSYAGADGPDGGLQAEPSPHGLGLQHDHGVAAVRPPWSLTQS
ncbi:hypothetical protein [Pseudonocardia yunnanensis]|uniref:Uncharacterized protein n=1 Tax=Pseudonocardia yunnanensis TaxID=58107 RepID=A0ABW4EVC2_9PSEU